LIKIQKNTKYCVWRNFCLKALKYQGEVDKEISNFDLKLY